MSLTPEERECLTAHERDWLGAFEEMPTTDGREAATFIEDLARTRLALNQEREDHERTAWAVAEWHDMGGDWRLYWDCVGWVFWIDGEKQSLGSDRTRPAWTPEARAAVDKARGEA